MSESPAALRRPLADDEPSMRLPHSVWEAMARGIRNRCPRCGRSRLFYRFLKPVQICPHCGQDWTCHQADDFPAYVSIFLTGHLLAPVIILLINHSDLSLGELIALVVVLTAVIALSLLQPAKGGIIAVQWWLGMHGFKKQRRDSDREEQ